MLVISVYSKQRRLKNEKNKKHLNWRRDSCGTSLSDVTKWLICDEISLRPDSCGNHRHVISILSIILLEDAFLTCSRSAWMCLNWIRSRTSSREKWKLCRAAWQGGEPCLHLSLWMTESLEDAPFMPSQDTCYHWTFIFPLSFVTLVVSMFFEMWRCHDIKIKQKFTKINENVKVKH